jgi:hypothetical protein
MKDIDSDLNLSLIPDALEQYEEDGQPSEQFDIPILLY